MKWTALLAPFAVAAPVVFGAETAPPSVNVVAAGPEISIRLGGLLQVQAEAGDPGDSRFDGGDRIYLRRARLNATGSFLEHFDFRLELELAGSLSKSTNLRAQMTDGYVEWNQYPAFRIRAGQYKTPFGYEQLYLDPLLPTLERTLVNDRLTAGRQLGAGVLGQVGPLSYSAGLFNGTGTNDNFNDNGNFLYAGRVSAVILHEKPSPLGPLSASVGVDGLTTHDASVSQASDFGFDSTPSSAAKDAIFSGKRDAVGADIQLRAGALDVWSEYLRATFRPDSAIPFSRFRSDGWSVQGMYFAIPKRLQVLARYETFDPDTKLHGASTRSWIAGGNVFLHGDNLKLQLDGYRTKTPQDGWQTRVLARIQAYF